MTVYFPHISHLGKQRENILSSTSDIPALSRYVAETDVVLNHAIPAKTKTGPVKADPRTTHNISIAQTVNKRLMSKELARFGEEEYDEYFNGVAFPEAKAGFF